MNTTEENAIFRVSSKDNYQEWSEFERRWTNLYRYLREHHSNLFSDVNSHDGTIANHTANIANHTHAAGNLGGTVDHVDLANKGTNTHAQIDSHIGDSSDPHGANLAQTTALIGSKLHLAGTSGYPGLIGFNRDTLTGNIYDDGKTAFQFSHISDKLYLHGYDADGNAVSTTYLCDAAANGAAWFYDNVSALSFTDRTKWFEGDAISALANISGSANNKLDHSTLPEFAKSKDGNERDLGAMISLLTVAIQQLTVRVIELEKSVIELKGK